MLFYRLFCFYDVIVSKQLNTSINYKLNKQAEIINSVIFKTRFTDDDYDDNIITTIRTNREICLIFKRTIMYDY